MSEPLIWRDEWALGIELLDAEHRVMVRLLNRLLTDDDSAPLTERLDALIAHLRRHFHTEEIFLRSIGFAGSVEHSRDHALQMAEFITLRRSVTRSGERQLSVVDRQAIRHWFFDHVIAGDRLFAIYYRDVVLGDAFEPPSGA
jgi:hemerythrin